MSITIYRRLLDDLRPDLRLPPDLRLLPDLHSQTAWLHDLHLLDDLRLDRLRADPPVFFLGLLVNLAILAIISAGASAFLMILYTLHPQSGQVPLTMARPMEFRSYFGLLTSTSFFSRKHWAFTIFINVTRIDATLGY